MALGGVPVYPAVPSEKQVVEMTGDNVIYGNSIPIAVSSPAATGMLLPD
jgi:hypothetical protein